MYVEHCLKVKCCKGVSRTLFESEVRLYGCRTLKVKCVEVYVEHCLKVEVRKGVCRTLFESKVRKCVSRTLFESKV